MTLSYVEAIAKICYELDGWIVLENIPFRDPRSTVAVKGWKDVDILAIKDSKAKIVVWRN